MDNSDLEQTNSCMEWDFSNFIEIEKEAKWPIWWGKFLLIRVLDMDARENSIGVHPLLELFLNFWEEVHYFWCNVSGYQELGWQKIKWKYLIKCISLGNRIPLQLFLFLFNFTWIVAFINPTPPPFFPVSSSGKI